MFRLNLEIPTLDISHLAKVLALITILLFAHPAKAELSDADNESIQRFLNSTTGYVAKIGEICEKYCDVLGDTTEVVSVMTQALSGYGDGALIVDQGLIDAIQRDADRLKGLSGNPPQFDLYTPERIAELESGDPIRMLNAYDAMIADRKEYIAKYERWLDKRAEAQGIFDETNAMSRRAYLLDGRLGHILDSAPGWFITAFFHLDQVRYDVAVPLTTAVENRYNAAKDLLDNYDDGIGEMRANIDSTENLVQFSEFLKAQDFPETRTESDPVLDLLETPKETPHLDEAASLFDRLDGAQGVDESGQIIAGIMRRMNVENDDVITEAQRLWQEAAAKDKEARRAAMIKGILTAGADAAGSFFGGSGSNAPNGGNAWYYERTWEYNETPGGNINIRIRDRGGVIP